MNNIYRTLRHNIFHTLAGVSFVYLVSGCASSNSDQPTVTTADIVAKELNAYIKEPFSDTTAVDVIYATNRTLATEKAACSDQSFGVGVGQKTNYGICKVNVPKRHIVGSFEVAPNPRADTHKYFKFISHKNIDNDEALKNLIKSKGSSDMMVFVHGFNVKFEEAVLRAAQIAYDVKFQGPVVLFSWPAGAGEGFLDSALVTRTYNANQANAAASVQAFGNFLGVLATLNLKIHVLAHSMGHQVVIPALAATGAAMPPKKFIGELVLNAPDFSVDEFTDTVPKFRSLADRITLYCSYNDNAISASETYNKGRRMGACERVEGVDVINVSEIDAPTLGVGGLGHGYYASRPILTDVSQLLLHINAEKRLFIRKGEPNATEDYIMRP